MVVITLEDPFPLYFFPYEKKNSEILRCSPPPLRRNGPLAAPPTASHQPIHGAAAYAKLHQRTQKKKGYSSCVDLLEVKDDQYNSPMSSLFFLFGGCCWFERQQWSKLPLGLICIHESKRGCSDLISFLSCQSKKVAGDFFCFFSFGLLSSASSLVESGCLLYISATNKVNMLSKRLKIESPS